MIRFLPAATLGMLCLLWGVSVATAQPTGSAVKTAIAQKEAAPASESSEALRLVSSSVLACVEVHRPADVVEGVKRSRLLSRWRQAPAYQKLMASDGAKQLVAANQAIRDRTGKSLTDQLLEAAEKRLVLAVFPGTAPRSEPEGVLLLEAASAAPLTRLMSTWESIDPAQRESRSYRNFTYVEYRKSSGDEPMFAATIGNVLVVSDQEARIKDCLDRSLTRGSGTIEQLPAYLAHVKTRSPQAAVSAFVPARAWDRLLPPAEARGAEEARLAMVWGFVSHLNASLELTEGLRLSAHVEMDAASGWHDAMNAWMSATTGTHAPAREPEESGRLTAHLASVLPHSLAGLAWHCDWPPISSLIREELEGEEARHARRLMTQLLGGRDPLDEVIPALFRDGTFAIYARPGAPGEPLLDGSLVIEHDPQRVSPELLDATGKGLAIGATVMSLEQSQRPAVTLRMDSQEGRALAWWETTGFFGGAVSTEPGRLVVAGSKRQLDATLARLEAGDRDAQAADQLLLSWCRQLPHEPNALVWVDLAALRNELMMRGPVLVDWAKGQHLGDVPLTGATGATGADSVVARPGAPSTTMPPALQKLTEALSLAGRVYIAADWSRDGGGVIVELLPSPAP